MAPGEPPMSATALLAPSRRLAPPLDFALVAGIIALALFASATPSPLYADYAARWHFSTPVLTSVYAVYAIGVLVALLLTGRLSDEVGPPAGAARRPRRPARGDHAVHAGPLRGVAV